MALDVQSSNPDSMKSLISALDRFLKKRNLLDGILYSTDGGLIMILKSLPEVGMKKLVWISSRFASSFSPSITVLSCNFSDLESPFLPGLLLVGLLLVGLVSLDFTGDD